MYALLRFPKSEFCVYPNSCIAKRESPNCIVNDSGKQYDAEIVTFHDNLNLLDDIKVQLNKGLPIIRLSKCEQKVLLTSSFEMSNTLSPNVDLNKEENSRISKEIIKNRNPSVGLSTNNLHIFSKVKTKPIFSSILDAHERNGTNINKNEINTEENSKTTPIFNDDMQLIFDGNCDVIHMSGNENIPQELLDFQNESQTTDQSILEKSKATIAELLTIASTQDHQFADDYDLFTYEDAETVRSAKSNEECNLSFSVPLPELNVSDLNLSAYEDTEMATNTNSIGDLNLSLRVPSPNLNVFDFLDDSYQENDKDTTYVPHESDADISDIQNNDVSAQSVESEDSLLDAVISNSTNLPGSSAPDDGLLEVEQSTGPTGAGKKNFCLYCKTFQSQLSRHLENKHKDQKDVLEFIHLPKKNKIRLELIGKIRRDGNFLQNSDVNYNKGKMLPARRPKKGVKKLGRDYIHCPKCKACLSRLSVRKHVSRCAGKSFAENKSIFIMGRQIIGNIHPTASKKLRQVIFPVLRDDDIVRGMRYDWLVVAYGNRMCLKYTLPHQHNMIRARLRLIGRLLVAIKEINTKIEDLASMFKPEHCDDVIEAIKTVSGYNENTEVFETPAVALGFGTLIKCIGLILRNYYIKSNDFSNPKDKRLKLEEHDYFTCTFEDAVPITINKPAMESLQDIKRNKEVHLPTLEDIKKLDDFLEANMKEVYEKLVEDSTSNNSKPFDRKAWVMLSRLVLISVQLFNRRRAGEMQRMKIRDYRSYKKVDRKSDPDSFSLLPPEHKQRAEKYARLVIRGKLGNDVPVLLNMDQIKYINFILNFRKYAEVSSTNPYVFGQKNTQLGQHKCLDACKWMREFSKQCGAESPFSLRGTELRKHVATMSNLNNFDDQKVSYLAKFMGHSKDIHKNIYVQPALNRDIITISEVLELAKDRNNLVTKPITSQNLDLPTENLITDNRMEISNEIDSDIQHTIQTFDEIPSPSNVSKRKCSFSSEDFSDDRRSSKKLCKKKIVGKIKQPIKRKHWSQEEKNQIQFLYSSFMKEGTFPSLKQIQRDIDTHPILQQRTKQQIKTYLSNIKGGKTKI